MISMHQNFRGRNSSRLPKISLLLLLMSSVNGYALSNPDITLRLNRAFQPYCVLKPDIGVEVKMIKDRDTLVAQVFNVAQEGSGYKSNLRDGDTLISVEGVATAGLTQKKLFTEAWSPAAEQAALKKMPLTVRKISRNGSGQDQEVKIAIERNCGFPSSDRYQESIVFAQAMEPEQSDNAIAFEMARDMAFAHFERQSTGIKLHVLGLIFGGASQSATYAISHENLDWRQESWAPRDVKYTDNDYLSVDYLAMVAMKTAGFSINNYLDNVSISNSAKPGNFVRVRGLNGKPNAYDADALEKLGKIHARVMAGDFKGGADLVDFKPTAPASTKAKRPDTHEGPIPKATNFALLHEATAIPRISAKANEMYLEWLEKPFPRAVAISNRGAFVRAYGRRAMTSAMESCEKTNHPCRLYAVDDTVVFEPFPPEQHEKKILAASNFAQLNDVDAVPHLSAKGKELYQQWLTKPFPRAVAISEKGALARGFGGDAMTDAVIKCEKFDTPCRLYAVDDRVVFIPFSARPVD